MITLIWISVFFISIYTTGFALTLWKQSNKVGSIAVMILVVTALICPYFVHIK